MLTPEQTARALTDLEKAAKTLESVYNTVNDDTQSTEALTGLIRNAGALQRVRDRVLAEYLRWDNLKGQFDEGLISFEEFVNKLHYEMLKLGASYDRPQVHE